MIETELTRHAGIRSQATPNQVCIRGRTLDLDALIRPRHFDPASLAALATSTRTAAPYPHVVVHDWFNPTLLELVLEEFDEAPPKAIILKQSRHELTHRLAEGAQLGPATALYFGIVNSGAFIRLLSRVSGVLDLVPDPGLHGAGLHETRNGGKFGIHRDFDRHPRTGLENRMVFITYLNKVWQPEWNGALELWDAETQACVNKIEPMFGRSILMLSGPQNFHGHPVPLNAPAGVTRRSIASYYYTNTYPGDLKNPKIGSVYISPDAWDRTKDVVRSCVPPVLWNLVKRMTHNG
jgi:2OG-Fe(II) oxygenase superfamily